MIYDVYEMQLPISLDTGLTVGAILVVACFVAVVAAIWLNNLLRQKRNAMALQRAFGDLFRHASREIARRGDEVEPTSDANPLGKRRLSR